MLHQESGQLGVDLDRLPMRRDSNDSGICLGAAKRYKVLIVARDDDPPERDRKLIDDRVRSACSIQVHGDVLDIEVLVEPRECSASRQVLVEQKFMLVEGSRHVVV